MSKTIKLCDGFRIYQSQDLSPYVTDWQEVLMTEDWQRVRNFFQLDVHSEEWHMITEQMFCFGVISFIAYDDIAGDKHYLIKAIPCTD